MISGRNWRRLECENVGDIEFELDSLYTCSIASFHNHLNNLYVFQILMSSDEELPDIPYCPLPEKRIRSDGEEAFLQLQKDYHDLLNIPAKQRSEEEKKEVIRLKNKYCNVQS